MVLLKVLFLFLFLGSDKPNDASGHQVKISASKKSKSVVDHTPQSSSGTDKEQFLAGMDTLNEADQELINSYGASIANDFFAAIKVKAKSPDFIFEVPISKTKQRENSSVRNDIEWALQQKPRPVTRLDSASRIVNYVFTHYAYGSNSVLDPSDYYSAPMEDIGNHINDNSLAGLCNDLAHFTGLLLTDLFPEWGTPVDLYSQPVDGKGFAHCFEGLANSEGVIYMVLDPTVNGIWIDSQTGQSLNLDVLRSFLSEPTLAHRVIKYSSTVFGRHRKSFQDGRFVFSIDFNSPKSLSALPVAAMPGYYIITGDMIADDDPNNFGFKQLLMPIWRQKGYLASTWANTTLEINNIRCENEDIARAINRKYRFSSSAAPKISSSSLPQQNIHY